MPVGVELSSGVVIETVAICELKTQPEPPALIDAWHGELKAVLERPDIKRRLTEFGLDVETSTPAEFSRRMAADFVRWQQILDEIGYKPPT